MHSDRNRAGNDSILQHHAKHQKDEIEQEHRETQRLIHLPLTGRDGDDDKEEHDEEQYDGTEEPVAADGHWSKTVDGRVHEPRDWKTFRQSDRVSDRKVGEREKLICIFFFQLRHISLWSSPHSDVEDVTAHRAGHSHVPQTFTGHDHTGNEVGDGRPCSQDGQAHNLL